MMIMKSIIYFVLLTLVCVGTASAQGAAVSSLSENDKARIAETARSARDKKRITEQKYQRIIYLLNTNPCNGVDRSLSEARKVQLALVIPKQLGLKSVEVLQSFSVKGWYVILVDTHVSDETFLFYSGNPATSSPITEWSGAATIMETDEIESWVLEHAPGIPSQMASCFAWHVTLDGGK